MYKPVSNHFCSGAGRWSNPLIEATMNSNEENTSRLCPNYVQEFGLWIKKNVRNGV